MWDMGSILEVIFTPGGKSRFFSKWAAALCHVILTLKSLYIRFFIFLVYNCTATIGCTSEDVEEQIFIKFSLYTIATATVGCTFEDVEKQGRQTKRTGDLNRRWLPGSGERSHYHFNGSVKLKERGIYKHLSLAFFGCFFIAIIFADNAQNFVFSMVLDCVHFPRN